MDILAKIKGIKYNPLLCRNLDFFDYKDIESALMSCSAFILNVKENKLAISWWVSAKRTRSYPYARVYDTLGFSGKKVTIIPVFKDEGRKGDRDFLQWDTVSLMSLLGVYVIIAYYVDAEPSKKERYKTSKITEQRFDIPYIKQEIKKLLFYQSDALHWNLAQIERVGEIGKKALIFYDRISKKFKIEMHLRQSAGKRITKLLKGKDEFMKLSRILAEKAQKRERLTIQPKEHLTGTKAIITIQNYLGGYYYFTSDEAKIKRNNVFLVEGKHSKNKSLPSFLDIKDGLLKMILFTNLEDVKIDNKKYHPIAILKLTVKGGFNKDNLTVSQKRFLDILHKEASVNNFQVVVK